MKPLYELLLKQHLDQVRLLRQHVEQIHQHLAVAMKEHLSAQHRLTRIPGVDLYASQELLAEIGPGAATFASAEQFASWVGVCPGSQESAGINYSHRSAKGNRFLRRLLRQIAWAAAHRIAKVVWLILHQGVEYEEKGPAPLNQRTLLRGFSPRKGFSRVRAPRLFQQRGRRILVSAGAAR